MVQKGALSLRRTALRNWLKFRAERARDTLSSANTEQQGGVKQSRTRPCWIRRSVSPREAPPPREGGGTSFLVGGPVNEVAFEAKLLWKPAWTEANFRRVFICRKRDIARSRRRNGGCEFSTLLFTRRPVSCRSALLGARRRHSRDLRRLPKPAVCSDSSESLLHPSRAIPIMACRLCEGRRRWMQ